MFSFRFFSVSRIPRTVGAIDGTHVKIIAPRESEGSCVNRKGYHSINVGATADLDPNFPGSCNISRECSQFKGVSLEHALQRPYVSAGRKHGVLGDSAHRLKNFLSKPYLGDTMAEPQTCFTEELQ
ncbi:hypothetical protein Q1695_003264 [Nippostrongylus brasiliensis]|nr:hypothetical protein Q1695_003264 [Nippostrongylus brasiliensis]